MPAYIIVMREEPVSDSDAMAEYQHRTRQLPGTIKPNPRVIYGELQALEGTPPDAVVMLEFDDMDTAREWYFSAAYQQALPYRLQSARHRAFLVDGYNSNTA